MVELENSKRGRRRRLRGPADKKEESTDDDSGIESLTSFVYSHFQKIHFTGVTRKIWNVG